MIYVRGSPMAFFKFRTFRKNLRRPVLFDLNQRVVWQPILNAASIFLFLDLDGTLVEIASRPADVSLSPERRMCLAQLSSAPGFSVAVVSGRKIEEVQRLTGLQGVFYIGLHGLEMVTPQGERISYPLGEPLMNALRSLCEEFGVSLTDSPGIFLEDKGVTVALHFRLAPKETAARVKRDFVAAVNAHQQRGVPLEILQGKEVIEAKPAGINKGKVVARVLDQYGSKALPIYLGDDFTDETAFQVIDRRGMAILVAEAPRKTAASFYLRNPDEVYQFLKSLLDWRGKTT